MRLPSSTGQHLIKDGKMAKLDFMIPIAERIEVQTITNKPRPYLGYSGIGHICSRKLWYDFRWCSKQEYSPRIQRLFNRGHAEENVIIADLEAAGCTITDREKEVTHDSGHIAGHIDGTIRGSLLAPKKQYLLEMKTMNDKYFKNYTKVGLKMYSSTYWQQIHSYMGKLKLSSCLYVVTNKNDEERSYLKIPFDKEQYRIGESRAFDVITAEEPPNKIGDKTFHICRLCNHYDICQRGVPIEVTCRTCHHADILPKGVWECSFHKTVLTTEDQFDACPDYNT